MSAAVRVGEGFVGEGAEAAHVNLVVGHREGVVGTAWATALATPTPGAARFQVVLQPGLAVQPPTLFVPKAVVQGDRHARLTWGPAQAGVAAAITRAVLDGDALLAPGVAELLVIAAVWVDPSADDADAVFGNNRAATAAAISDAGRGGPGLDALAAAAESPWNPFYTRLRG